MCKCMCHMIGGADFNPYSKSETEIQRFCQSYMQVLFNSYIRSSQMLMFLKYRLELSKYIGPDKDLPGLGDGVGSAEIGYLYGQYKRINHHCGQFGQGLLWVGGLV